MLNGRLTHTNHSLECIRWCLCDDYNHSPLHPVMLMSSQQSLYVKHWESQKQEIERFEEGNTSQSSPTQHPLNPASTHEPELEVMWSHLIMVHE